MNVVRIQTSDLNVFKTFDGYRNPEFLDIQTPSTTPAHLEDLPNLGLAIVGTRHPQKRSLELLDRTLSELRGSNLIIISGFARGIDSRAHELAIQNGLRTIAILGCGIDIDYPRENRRLRNSIFDSGGMILSPCERGMAPIARNFYERNGLIAGFSKAVWVVEAAAVSGTLNTATWATKFNRALYATSCFPNDPFYQGNEKLLSQNRSDRYPLAEPFFNAQSLGSTWPDLHSSQSPQSSFELLSKAKTDLQRWILELKHQFGQCHPQALLQHAYQNGLSPGSFYRELEKELASGKINQTREGTLEVIP